MSIRIPAGRLSGALYRTIWRWHFYAALFSMPFIALLAATGAIYLFKPQIDAWIDRPYDRIALAAPAHSLDDEVAAARAAYPQARLKGVELRADPADAARILLMAPGAKELRVYVEPDTLAILKATPEQARFTTIIHDIHGQLLAGDAGAVIVELAGAWAIVMVVTGLYLWWPRDANGLGGILYPRLGDRRRFLRDLHAVTGIWLSAFALFFLISALPWTRIWGREFQSARAYLGAAVASADWTTGPSSEKAVRQAEYRDDAGAGDSMSGMDMGGGMAGMDMPDGSMAGTKMDGMKMDGDMAPALSFEAIAALVRPMALADPVIVQPPSSRRPNWTVRSDAQDRPERVTLTLDRSTGKLLHRDGFENRSLVDRIVAVGVAAHEGQLFGWINQTLGLMTALGFLTVVVSGFLLWWRRRPEGVLGAPPATARPHRLAPLLVVAILTLAILLPTLGLSLAVVLVVERLILRRIPLARAWLGLRPTVS